MQQLNFAGKRIVITGAYSGIGASLLELLRGFGADDIVVLDIKEPEADVEGFIETDMGNPLSIDNAIAELTAEGNPKVSLLFNNAGVAATLPADTVMRINILGLKRLTQRLMPSMQPGGAIVNTASVAGNGWPEHVNEINQFLEIDSWDEGVSWIADHTDVVADGYFFSKECVQVYTMRAAKAATGFGLRMNSVCPSPVETPLLPAFRETMTDQIIDWAIETGAGRVATAEDQARALLSLGSELSVYINGVNLLVDGGYTAALQTGQFTPPGAVDVE
ncbi:MAG: coniferyl-alcohol dehydrogenase [Pseudomonadales bacterium]|nr:coniferyl-alcohol dehydrogenase [Pseudomonadales bacterium]MBO6701144.1 coniferyl-alcohol dehydrogenase [Pseudomonadales bacterium]MBO7005009.1 coniferyl-alcohol dehydrogenase [Pseudomonadales bacterium]